jgi:hypothetical protein
MFIKRLLGFAFLAFSSLLLATETAPFYVSKVGGSGEYSSKQFGVLWSAFRMEYSITEKGTFESYSYTEHVLREAQRTSSRSFDHNDFFSLFYDPERKENSQSLTGNQEAWKSPNKYVSHVLAMEGARRYGARLASVIIGPAKGSPGVFGCTLKSMNDDDTGDVRDDSPAPNSQTSIILCDPKNARSGAANIYIESHSYYGKGSSGNRNYSQLREVGTLLDSKDNQDNFLAALKAGSSFPVFWFKEINCTNCGGFGRLSTLATNQKSGRKSPFGGDSSESTLSLSSKSSPPKDRCPACVGTGKRMRGYITTIMWAEKGPVFEPSR